MTKLLISVKNPQEACMASEAGADFIDLKDPADGALGSLNANDTLAILKALQGKVAVSATIGEVHACWPSQIAVLEEKIALGVKILKLPVVEAYFNEAGYVQALTRLLRAHPVQLIGVFFAESPFHEASISHLARLGFYGAMLDTQDKTHDLLGAMPHVAIAQFVKLCKINRLEVGLAGALRIECLTTMVAFEAGYLGFRSGVCECGCRKNSLLAHKVKEISEKLYKHNNLYVKMEL